MIKVKETLQKHPFLFVLAIIIISQVAGVLTAGHVYKKYVENFNAKNAAAPAFRIEALRQAYKYQLKRADSLLEVMSRAQVRAFNKGFEAGRSYGK